MIIVSQDKEEIVNFDTINSLWICPDSEGRFTIEATADTNATLGYYKTEERAKEVLQEIIKTIIEDKKLEQGEELFGFSLIPKNTYYEMPKE